MSLKFEIAGEDGVTRYGYGDAGEPEQGSGASGTGKLSLRQPSSVGTRSKNTRQAEKLDFSQFDGRLASIDELLLFCTNNKCSDLYIKVGQRPFVTRWGLIHQVPCFPITAKIWNDWAKKAITSENNAKYVRQKMLDFSYTILLERGGGLETSDKELRYRVSAGYSMGKSIATFRMISESLPSFSNINFPDSIAKKLHDMLSQRQGIVLFVGVTGSGKTTTMAACMNDFSKMGGPLNNATIISLEDPVEYLFPYTENVNILQKELGVDFKDFASGVKQSLREHPNFVNVGETRDRETVETLVEAARTGHMCCSSFHASDVSDTIARMYNMLAGQNEGVMYDVITNMDMILCQRLIPGEDGFHLDTQYMVFNDSIKVMLNEAIGAGENIPLAINRLMRDKKLLEQGLVKEWDSKKQSTSNEGRE